MQIYLPIAEISANIFLFLALGGVVGFLSGLFGVGGGFLATPLLIFMGVPPAVAVASQANQIAGASVSGALAHWRAGTLDLRMGLVLTIGGLAGSGFGASIYRLLQTAGQIDLVISVSYVILLGAVGGLMLHESLGVIRRSRRGEPTRRIERTMPWIDALPLKMRFPKSRLYVSALAPLALGFMVGVLAAIIGVGGGFVLVPAMIYLLRMPTNVVIGTSLFNVMFVACSTTFLLAVNSHTVDVVLAMLLLVGGVVGAQFGAKYGRNLSGEKLRAWLGALVLTVCAGMAYGLFMRPDEPFSLVFAGS